MTKEELILLKEKLKQEAEELYFSYSQKGIKQAHNPSSLVKDDADKVANLVTTNLESLIRHYTQNNIDIESISLPLELSIFVKKPALDFGNDEIIDEGLIIDDLVKVEICPATIGTSSTSFNMTLFNKEDYKFLGKLPYMDINIDNEKSSFIVSFDELKASLEAEGFIFNSIKSFNHLKQNAIIGETTKEKLQVDFYANQTKKYNR